MNVALIFSPCMRVLKKWSAFALGPVGAAPGTIRWFDNVPDFSNMNN